MSRRRWWRLAQVGFIAAVLWYCATYLVAQWGDIAALRASLRPDWLLVLASGALVLVSYVVLIVTWQSTVRAWGSALSFRDAARIWFVSNLGKYIPGKVWTIGAMSVLAQRASVSPTAAVGSSLVVTVVHVVAGFMVVAIAGGSLLGDVRASWLGPVVAVVALAAAPALLPKLARLGNRIAGRTMPVPALPLNAIGRALVGCTIAWVLYGQAFRLLAIALLGHATGNGWSYTAVFTLSYLTGFLTLFSPGGVGTREVVMGALLARTALATGAEATLLVLASRLWLTVLEIMPGVTYLAMAPRRTKAPPS